jgi:hypothetical protein
MDVSDFEKKKLEYSAAQEMLRHYDSLNWQIGAILIAATIVLTGLVLRKEVIDLIQGKGILSWGVAIGIPAFSLFVLKVWLLWFRRHRDLYNFRNETLHRLEISLGLYHYLRVVEADLANSQDSEKIKVLAAAKSNAGYTKGGFVPFYDRQLSKPSGNALAKVLAYGIPVFQLTLLLAIKCG